MRLASAAALVALLSGASVAGAAWLGTTDAGRHRAAHTLRRVLGPPPSAAQDFDPTSAPSQPATHPSEAETTGREAVAGGEAAQAGKATPPEPPRAGGSRESLPPPPSELDTRAVSHVLLLGEDRSRPGVRGRTDAMVVLAFHHRDGKVGAFSIPRDLWVPLPEVEAADAARINAVARVGDVRLGPGEGLPLLRRVIARELGVRIDHYALVDFTGFAELIDGLGGVEVDVPCPIVDCFWEGKDRSACQMMEIGAGRQQLDGRSALRFARSRHGTGDRDRNRRQQLVLAGLARKLGQVRPSELRALWELAARHLETDLDWRAAAYYGSFAMELDPAELGGFSVRHPMVSRHVTEARQHVLLLDRPAFDEARASIFSRPAPALAPRRSCPEPDAALTYRQRSRSAKSPG